MNCPVCNKEMKVVRTDISHNGEEGEKHAEYNRTVFHCEEDDVWANTEIPIKHINKNVA